MTRVRDCVCVRGGGGGRTTYLSVLITDKDTDEEEGEEEENMGDNDKTLFFNGRNGQQNCRSYSTSD